MKRLGRYEILAELGRGAMGTVFRARDPKIDRIVAVKTIAVLGANPAEKEEYLQRFFREAQAAGRLSDPGIVTVYDVGEDEEARVPFIVMEYVAGQTLDQMSAPDGAPPCSVEKTLDLVQQIARALDYAHSQGIVHRDIKPANIIVTEAGRAKIADFGIAKVSATEMTVSGQVLGTPAYMSPEQLNGGKVDGRSDLFSLGVILYWMLTGGKPFAGDSVTSVSFKVVYKDPSPATEMNPDLGPEFDYVLARALAKDPARRYQRAKELASDLEDIRAGRAPRSQAFASEPPVPLEERTVVQKPKQKSASASAAAGVAPARARTTNVTQPGERKPLVKRVSAFALQQMKKMLPAHPGKRAIAYAALTVTALAIAVFSITHAGPPPAATLQIRGQHPFRSAQITIWIDGELRYTGEIAGVVRRHTSFFKSTFTVSGTLQQSLPLRAGKHSVRIGIRSLSDEYDQTQVIEGNFLKNQDRTLRVGFGRSGKEMILDWQ